MQHVFYWKLSALFCITSYCTFILFFILSAQRRKSPAGVERSDTPVRWTDRLERETTSECILVVQPFLHQLFDFISNRAYFILNLLVGTNGHFPVFMLMPKTLIG